MSVFLFVHLSVRMEQASHRMDFLEIWHLQIFLKYVEKIKSLIKIQQE